MKRSLFLQLCQFAKSGFGLVCVGTGGLGKLCWCSEAQGELQKGRERRGQTGGIEVSCVVTGLGRRGGGGGGPSP